MGYIVQKRTGQWFKGTLTQHCEKQFTLSAKHSCSSQRGVVKLYLLEEKHLTFDTQLEGVFLLCGHNCSGIKVIYILSLVRFTFIIKASSFNVVSVNELLCNYEQSTLCKIVSVKNCSGKLIK